jgi:predicted dehydrogenase
MENSKIKIGIVGCGRMGITHYSIINSFPEVEVTAVADPSAFVLTLIDKYLPVKTYRNYEDMFAGSDLDAVLVCTPPSLHYKILRKAAEKGISVFVEKPFTTKYSEGSELAGIFSSRRLVNQVGYVNRFNDVFMKTKQLLDKGVIGKIIRFKSEMFSCTITRPDGNSGWRTSHESGGGAIFEMATHAIDLVNYLIGKPDKVTGSSLNHIYSKNVEDAVSSTFLYNNGMSGTIFINWSDTSYRKPTNKIELFGDGGKMIVDQHTLKIYLNKPDPGNHLLQGWNTLYITDVFTPVPFYVRGNEFTRQLGHFIGCLRGHEWGNKCSFADGSDTLEVVEKIFNDYELNGKINYGTN